ncbi:MAG: ABC transporter substrate-binding protein [Chloroflexota bacterium]|nr:peptide ABC transporter substrate-binding protein [Chloroflexota bacterium]NOG61942.1 peptide ABC transporter substrate-binding protein [Chloroflexota bacterium]GIK62470.1 MAG: ABC transporter substrate-binding protein [Chloroflexota bacterium]
MSKSTFRLIPVAAIVLTLVVALLPTGFAAAEDATVTVVAQYRQDTPVTIDGASQSEISSLDPAIISDSVSIIPVENLFLGLTDYDPITSAINPELATSWEVSADGLVWTFNLRSDVNWMRYDPATETAAVVRPVVAGDIVYGIKRGCDPRLGGYYGTISAKVIKGCDVVNQTVAENVTDDLVYGETIAVSAPDDVTLVVELQFAAGYFFSMTPMWMLRAVPQEVIEEFGDEWTAPGNIVSNGPFFVQEITRGVRRVYVRNEALPADLFSGTGNVEVINTTVIEDAGTIYALYQNSQLDSSGVPAAEIQNVLSDPTLSQEVLQIFDLTVFYFGFGHDKAPFDNVHARRAFSAIIDRQAFIEQVLAGRGVPMIHFTPPGMAHAPAINEIGVGFDPEYAVAEMEAAGYPNCEGFPAIDMVAYQGAGTWTDFWAAAAEEYLGCDPSLLNVEQLEFSVLLEIVDPNTPTQDRPNAWTLGWGPDYGDANNWVNDVLSCTSDNAFLRPCTEVDDLINQAAAESDPAVRDQLYAEIEESFFGAEGEYPIAPIYLRSFFTLVKPWYTGPFESDGLFGGAHWGAYNIDMAAKLAARGE